MQEMLQTMILFNSSIEVVGDGQLFLRQKIYNEGVAPKTTALLRTFERRRTKVLRADYS